MISEFRTRKLTAWFNLWDVNNDGFIDEADITAQTNRLAELRNYDRGSPEHRRVTETQMELHRGLLAEADANNDGKLSLPEYLAFYEAAGEALASGDKGVLEKLIAAADAQFDIVDADHDGIASLEEYVSWLESWDSDIAAEPAFEKMDVDGNGKLTKDEIRHIVRDFYFGEDPSAPGTHLIGVLD